VRGELLGWGLLSERRGEDLPSRPPPGKEPLTVRPPLSAHLGHTVFHQDVVALDVAVHKAGIVDVLQAEANLQPDEGDVRNAHAGLRHCLARRLLIPAGMEGGRAAVSRERGKAGGRGGQRGAEDASHRQRPHLTSTP
jgi:hypothetical protein